MYQEDNNSMFPSAGTVFVGIGALGTAAYLGRYMQKNSPAVLQKLGQYEKIASSAWYGKFKESVGAGYSAKGHGFWNNLVGPKVSTPLREGISYRSFETVGGKVKGFGTMRVPEYVAAFMPRSREVASWEKPFYKFSARTRGKIPSRVMKASAAGLFSVMTMNDAINEHGVMGIPIGAMREIGAGVGGIFGGAMGATLGHRLTKGLTGAGGAGKMIGMGIGAMAGFVAIDGLIRLSKLGKKWSTPELGGRYSDSDTSMTMRQRSMNAISTSQFNIRNSLGRESLNLHGLV